MQFHNFHLTFWVNNLEKLGLLWQRFFKGLSDRNKRREEEKQKQTVLRRVVDICCRISVGWPFGQGRCRQQGRPGWLQSTRPGSTSQSGNFGPGAKRRTAAASRLSKTMETHPSKREGPPPKCPERLRPLAEEQPAPFWTRRTRTQTEGAVGSRFVRRAPGSKSRSNRWSSLLRRLKRRTVS